MARPPKDPNPVASTGGTANIQGQAIFTGDWNSLIDNYISRTPGAADTVQNLIQPATNLGGNPSLKIKPHISDQTFEIFRVDDSLDTLGLSLVQHDFIIVAGTHGSPPLGISLAGNADPTFGWFVDTNFDGTWTPGEPIIWDKDLSQTYSAGDVVLYGSTPSLGSALTLDSRILFWDFNNNGLYDTGEAVIIDGDFTGTFTGLLAIKGNSFESVGLLPYFSIVANKAQFVDFSFNHILNLDLVGSELFSPLLMDNQVTRYNNITTAGYGVPAIFGRGRQTAKTAAIASLATYTVGASDGTFEVYGNINVTAFIAGTFNMTVAYTDETNTGRTLTLNFSSLTGTLGIAITGATGPFEGIPTIIRAKASTTITMATSGTFTNLTYNAEGTIIQVA